MAIQQFFKNVLQGFKSPNSQSNRRGPIDSTYQEGSRSFGSALERQPRSDKLELVYRELSGIRLKKDICDLIDEFTTNDPILSQVYTVYTSAADTKFKLDLTLRGKGDSASEAAKKYLEETIPPLFLGCKTLQDVRRLFISNLIKYSYLGFQVITDESQGRIERVVIPQAWSIHRKRKDNRWIPLQVVGREPELELDIPTYHEYFLFFDVTNDGIFPKPLFKAALKPSTIYNLFQNSLKEIAVRTGMQAILDISFDREIIKNVTGAQSPLLSPGEKPRDLVSEIIKQNQQMISESAPNGKFFHGSEVEIKALTTVEPAATLTSFKDMLVSDVVIGAKFYPGLTGLFGKENQTTLSSNQKLVWKSILESIIAVADDALYKICFDQLSLANIAIKEFEIKSEPPQLDDEKTLEEAKKLRLENERTQLTNEEYKKDPSLLVKAPVSSEAENSNVVSGPEPEAESRSLARITYRPRPTLRKAGL